MADACLARPNHEGTLAFEAVTLLTKCGGTAAERAMEPKDWIPNIRALRRALKLSRPQSGPRLQMGYQPGGGRGNVSLYWLELESEGDNQSAEVEPSTTVIYRRSANGSLKPSLVARLFLRQGEMCNFSARGIIFLSTIFLGSTTCVVMLALMLLSLSIEPGPITTGKFIILILTVLGFVFIWREFWHPWFRVVNDCVVKAPLWLTAISEKNSCELEMFRQGKYRWTRLVRFSADCPICGSNIELRPGKPDQNLPLVGRCIESPYAHVYSFDRMTLQGTYLGPSMPSKPYALRRLKRAPLRGLGVSLRHREAAGPPAPQHRHRRSARAHRRAPRGGGSPAGTPARRAPGTPGASARR